MKIDVFTDGACSGDNIGGWGYLLICTQDNGQTIRRAYRNAAPNMTNQRAELMAVVAALSNFTAPTEVTIHSDSAYIVNCFHQGWYLKWLQNGWKNSKNETVANQELWMRILHLMDKHSVTYVKVKGHNGHVENEFADQMATTAIRDYRNQAAIDANIAAGADVRPRYTNPVDGQKLGEVFDPTQLLGVD